MQSNAASLHQGQRGARLAIECSCGRPRVWGANILSVKPLQSIHTDRLEAVVDEIRRGEVASTIHEN